MLARYIDISATNTSKSAFPWNHITFHGQPDLAVTNRNDLLSRFESAYGKRIKGTMKTNRKTGHVCAEFCKEWPDGRTIARVSWFEEIQ